MYLIGIISLEDLCHQVWWAADLVTIVRIRKITMGYQLRVLQSGSKGSSNVCCLPSSLHRATVDTAFWVICLIQKVWIKSIKWSLDLEISSWQSMLIGYSLKFGYWIPSPYNSNGESTLLSIEYCVLNCCTAWNSYHEAGIWFPIKGPRSWAFPQNDMTILEAIAPLLQHFC